VTRSMDFYETDSLGRISGATVELINGTAVKRLNETSPGTYFAGDLEIIEGSEYLIRVQVSEEEKYTAVTRAPVRVVLDTLKVVRGFGDPRPTAPPVYLINPLWLDPAGIPNYYRFKVTTNGKSQSGGFSITSDEQFDGTLVDTPIYWFAFALGDSVRFEFINIDSVSYAYFRQINDMARPSFVSATPYNPDGNFDNGALGYFGICYTEVRQLVITAGK
jgi:hypothetical protein